MHLRHKRGNEMKIDAATTTTWNNIDRRPAGRSFEWKQNKDDDDNKMNDSQLIQVKLN